MYVYLLLNFTRFRKGILVLLVGVARLGFLRLG